MVSARAVSAHTDGDRTEQIARQERLLRSAVDSLDSRICMLGDHGVVVYTNLLWDEFCTAMGWSPGEAGVGANFFAVLHLLGSDLQSPVGLAVIDVLAAKPGTTGHPVVRGHIAIGDDGEDVVVRVHPVSGNADVRAVVTMVDDTVATGKQRELRQIADQAQLLALVAQHTDNAVVIADAEGRMEWANEAFCQMSGYRSDELIGQRRQDLIRGPFSRTPAFAGFVEALTCGRSADVKFPTETKDGRSYWVHIQIQPIIENGRSVRFVSVERDITLQRGADEQLRAAIRKADLFADELSSEKALLSDVLGSIPHLVYWKDSELRYTGVNQAFLSMRALGAEGAVLERTEAELEVADELSATLLRLEPLVLSTGQAVQNERLTLTVTDRVCSLMLSVLPQTDEHGAVCGVIGVAADVTHVTTLEQQVAQATRLESIGQLASGMAHEINTPVQYVSDNTRFLAQSFPKLLTALQAADDLVDGERFDPDELRQALARIDLDFLAAEIPGALRQSQEGLDRVSQIVRAMKDFSHPGQGRVDADLNRAVESTVQVSRSEWRFVADLGLDLSPDVGLVPCFEGELKQVLLNIVMNAAQAIEAARENTGSQDLGRIQIRTERVPDAVRITVTDDGPGMSEDVRNKIFDPFFTTKPVGKGTGQGLSMAYAVIVQKHGGKLTVTSTPGLGSTFTIDLPNTITGATAADIASPDSANLESADSGGTGSGGADSESANSDGASPEGAPAGSEVVSASH